jgi:hypothetical membrane protein
MAAPTEGMAEQPLTLRLLLACGVIGPLFFIIVFLIEGAVRPDYSLLRHPVSALSMEDRGWIQVANFIITGLLLLAFALGLRRVLLPASGTMQRIVLISLVGIGLIGAGIFVIDPLNGYPPGTPLVPEEGSVHGNLHNLFSLAFFVGLPIACFSFRRQFARSNEHGWAIYSALSGIAIFVLFVLSGLGFYQVAAGLADVAGVFQRLSIITGLIWIALLALRFMGYQPLHQRGR